MKPVALLLLIALATSTLPLVEASAAEPRTVSEATLIDPFYLSLLKDGMQSYEDGRPETAAQALRLACFGMLETPQLLTGCLIRLGAAQAASDDRTGFSETFRRLAEVEERFATYRGAAVPAEIRNEFDRFLVRWIAEEQLAALPAFEPLSTRRIIAKLKRLPNDEHRKELEKRIEEQPEMVAWRVALAELEQELGRYEPALAQLEKALAKEADNEGALCLRGIVEQKKGDCAAAGKSFARCPNLAQDAAVAEAMLTCQVKTGDGVQARATLALLPKEWLTDRRFERLIKQIEKLPAAKDVEKTAEPPPPSSEPEPTALAPPTSVAVPPDPPPTPAAPPAAAPVNSPKPAGLPEELAKKAALLRQEAAKVQYASDLAAPAAAAEELANTYPEHSELQWLAAEIAYRASQWRQAARFFERGGDPGENRPVMLFYWAVSLYESDQRQRAADVLERALPKLNRTPLVDAYKAKILPAEGDGGS